jgi:hypothetical protein
VAAAERVPAPDVGTIQHRRQGCGGKRGGIHAWSMPRGNLSPFFERGRRVRV